MMESIEMVAPYQIGFRRGRQTMAVCLENKVKKAQMNKETVGAVFYEAERTTTSCCGKSFRFIFDLPATGGKIPNWVVTFLNERAIQVTTGAELSNQHVVENGTPQGSVLNPTLLSIMISDISKNIAAGVGLSLFAHSLLCALVWGPVR